MHLRVDPPALRDDLLEFLRACSCLAVKHAADQIEAHLLNSVSRRHDDAVIAGHVETWKVRHGHASVEIISS